MYLHQLRKDSVPKICLIDFLLSITSVESLTTILEEETEHLPQWEDEKQETTRLGVIDRAAWP